MTLDTLTPEDMRADGIPVEKTKRAHFAIGSMFFVNGLVFANWLPRIPEVRDHLGMKEGRLGITLIGAGVGGLIGSFLVPKLQARFGTRLVMLGAALVITFLIPLIGFAPTPTALMALLVSLGLLDVQADMAMNAQAATIQELLGRSVMQRLHGMWSLGFTLGAGLGWLASVVHLGLRVHLALVSVLMVCVLMSAEPHLLTNAQMAAHVEKNLQSPASSDAVSTATSKSMARRFSVGVVAMAAMAIAVSWLEASPNDWSAVTLNDVFHAGRFVGSGPMVFAGSMLFGRLFGDRVLDRIGATKLFDGALTLAFVGAAAVVLAPHFTAALVGFSCWGLGASVLFPQLYTMAARVPGTSAGAGLGAMGVGQRFGFLTAPLIVGNVAEASNMRVGFSAVAGCALVIALIVRIALRRYQSRAVN
jgi:MFS family permease